MFARNTATNATGVLLPYSLSEIYPIDVLPIIAPISKNVDNHAPLTTE